MALSGALAKAGTPPERLQTSATVTFVPGTGITKSALTVRGSVPGLDADGFREAAEGAKQNCPVSKALAGRPRDHASTLSSTRSGSAERLSATGAASINGAMAATIENLIDELERSYTEVQERMSDPSVYNDHREAAEVGRRLKELETPYKLAQEWRAMREDVQAVARRPRAEGARRRVRGAPRRARGGAEARARRDGSGRPEGRDRRDPPGRRRRRGRDLGRRRLPHADPLRREPRLQDRAALGERERGGRLQGGRRSRSRATARTRSSSTRAARTASSASPRPSRRAGSTPRRRRSR